MLNASYFTKTELEMFKSQSPIFNDVQMKFINRKTPYSEIEQKTDKSGFKHKSVKSGYVKALVTLVTGGNYSFEIKEQVFLSSAKEIRTTAKLTIYTALGSFTREQNGKAECNIPEANAYKASASDAFKKCASEFGFCWDIYNQENAEPKKEEEPELDHAEKKKLERLEHFLSEATSPEQIQHNYNTHLKTSKETEQSKALLKKHMERLGFTEA